MNLELNIDLQLTDFKAEEITDSTVWVYKSHDPEQKWKSKRAVCNKVICCVRNPFDQIPSSAQFGATKAQSGSINEKLSDFPEQWNTFLRGGAQTCHDYHEKLMADVPQKVPIYYIRYEDLRVDPQTTLEGLFCFILNLQSLEGTNIQRRIKHVCDQGHAATVSYAQKVPSYDLSKQEEKKPIIFNRHINQFSPE